MQWLTNKSKTAKIQKQIQKDTETGAKITTAAKAKTASVATTINSKFL